MTKIDYYQRFMIANLLKYSDCESCMEAAMASWRMIDKAMTVEYVDPDDALGAKVRSVVPRGPFAVTGTREYDMTLRELVKEYAPKQVEAMPNIGRTTVTRLRKRLQSMGVDW